MSIVKKDITTDNNLQLQSIVTERNIDRINGQLFSLNAYDKDLDSAAELIISFKTGVNFNVHASIDFICTNLPLFELLEAPTITADSGTNIVILNNDLNSSIVSGLTNAETVPANTGTLGATISADGTIKLKKLVGTETLDVILKKDTVYALRVTSDTADSIAHMNLFFTEEG